MIPLDTDVLPSSQSRVSTGRAPDQSADISLIDLLRSHGEREGTILRSYQRLADRSEDEAIRYVVRLIIEDESRHHQQLSEMLNELHSIVWDLDIEPRMPETAVRHDTVLLTETKRLLAFEKEDARQLRRLSKELRRTPGHPFFPLLVRVMLHDTRKHIDILRFIRSRVRQR